MKNASLFLDVTMTLLRHGSRVRFRASGQSMHPTIQEGDIITVAPVTPTAVQRGDVLLYHAARGVIAHRVVRAETTGETRVFTLRGDASCSCDAPVEAQHILGKIVWVERHGRHTPLARRRPRLWHRFHAYAARLKQWIGH